VLCGCCEGSKEGPKRPVPIPAPTLPTTDRPAMTPPGRGTSGASDAAGRGIDAQGAAEPLPEPASAGAAVIHAVDLMALPLLVRGTPLTPQGGRGLKHDHLLWRVTENLNP